MLHDNADNLDRAVRDLKMLEKAAQFLSTAMDAKPEPGYTPMEWKEMLFWLLNSAVLYVSPVWEEVESLAEDFAALPDNGSDSQGDRDD